MNLTKFVGQSSGIWWALLLWCVPLSQANAIRYEQKYVERVQTSSELSAYTFDSFGENVNMQTGATSFSWTDIDIPGNTGLPVRLQRTLVVEDKFQVPSGGLHQFGDSHTMSLDVPYLKGTFSDDGWQVDDPNPNARCTLGNKSPKSFSTIKSTDYWNGNWMHIPWVGEQEILRTPSADLQKPGSAPLMTRNQWAFECLATTKNGYPGEGFVAISPQGERYYFDWAITQPTSGISKRYGNYAHSTASISREIVLFLVTRIEDRFGNWVTYDYSGDQLSAINASDGRYIRIVGQVDGNITTVDSSLGRWTYSYGGGATLTVTRPDQSTYKYVETGLLEIVTDPSLPLYTGEPRCPGPLASSGDYSLSVTLPSGATAAYQFKVQRHGINNVPFLCASFIDEQLMTYQYLIIPNFSDSFTLKSKTVSGVGMPTSVWTYKFSTPGIRAFEDICADPPSEQACPATSTGLVLGPNSTYTQYTFGNLYNINSGQLLATEQGYVTGADPNLVLNPLRTVQNEYVSEADMSTVIFPNTVGYTSSSSNDVLQRASLRPVKKRITMQDGVSFTWSVDSTCNGNNTLCFDKRARPTTVTKSSTLNYSRTDASTYPDNTTKWVLGQVGKVTCMKSLPISQACDGGTDSVESETSYHAANAMPWQTKAFGKLQQTLLYDTTSPTTNGQLGTLSSITDGKGQVTLLSSWKRGLPQLITFPATTDQPVAVSKSAVVGDDGWLRSVTDENGYKTTYEYDAMGRVRTIIYPTGDSTNWNTTTIVYEQMTVGAYGIDAGHWRRTESTGDARKVTDFDAMWRPLVENQYDNTSSTRRLTVKRYDPAGRPSFQSYPMGGLSGGYTNPALTGTRTFYDALDRVASVEQDAEDGTILTTLTAYLTGFKTQVTNPRTFKTITSYMAFDQPTNDWPVTVQSAVGRAVEQATDITRDVFGKPTAITRHDPAGTASHTRSYVYDVNQLLCKSVEPETGATLANYDAAGNIDWSAAGQSLTALTCDRASVLDTERVKRTYDARNRLKTLRFADGRGNQDWTYVPDGLPNTITTSNGLDGNIVVANGYHYNKRRMLDGTGETVTETGWYTWGIGHSYDGNGSPSALNYPSGLSVSFAPNALGQPTQAGSYATDVTYWPNGAIKRFVYGNGIIHDMTQNERQLPETSKDTYGSTKILYDSYVYDANANVVSILDGATGRGNRGDRDMGYDALDRLMMATSPMFGNGAPNTVSYTHDVMDNLVRLTMPATGPSNPRPGRDQYYCYDTRRRLTSLRSADNCAGSSLVDFTYDAQGNLASKGGQTYDFGKNNRLYAVDGKEAYRYDGLGYRVLSWSAQGLGNILSMYTREGQLLQVTNARTAIRSEYVYLGGSLVGIRESPTVGGSAVVKYQHTDALGTPVAVTNASRAVIERSEYEPFGQLLNRPITDGPGFTGHVQDALTELTYMQQRYYDPMIGRFLSVDPVTANSGTGANFNRYWYANNNPYKFTDPDGRQSVGEWLHQKTEETFQETGGGAKAFGMVFAETAWKYLGAEGVSQVADKGWGNTSTGDKVGAGIEVLGAIPGAKILGAASREATTVIGKIADLGRLRQGEKTLLDRLPNLGNPKANWVQNSSVLREELRRGAPIRDASVNAKGELINNTGFLRAERNVLVNKGWTYDQKTTMWNGPAQ